MTDNQYAVQTKVGPLQMTFTSGKHVCVYTNRNHESFLTVNRVEYTLNAHVYLWSDGQWHLGEEGKNQYERGQSLHATRKDWLKYSDSHPSQAARERMIPVVEQAVRDLLALKPQATRDAQLEYLTNELEKANHVVEEKRKEYEAAVLEQERAARILKNEKVAA